MRRWCWAQTLGRSLPAAAIAGRAVTILVCTKVLCVCTASRTVLAQWALFADQKALLGKTIVDVGEVRSEYTSSTSRLERRREWLVFRGQEERCLDASGFSVGGSAAALLLVDENRGVYLAVFKPSIGSVDVDVSRTRAIECERQTPDAIGARIERQVH